ncbi:MAG: TlpA disulfide reductase family protein [Pseudomonadota bacterium]
MSSRLPLTVLALALFLAGCDRGADEAAQQQQDLASEKAGLAGVVDRKMAGSEMPALSFEDLDGNTLDLAALKGAPVLINLWATWCAPCVIEMPMLDNLANEMGEDLRVLTISQDSKGAEVVAPFFAEHSYDNLESWLDPENDLAFEMSGAGAMPLTVLYDADGTELLRVAGGYHWDSEEAIALVSEAIGK